MRKALLWSFWIGEVLVLLQTLAAYWLFHADPAPLGWFLVCALLMALLFYAEGLELAVADLGDKDADQIGDPHLRDVLQKIQERMHFFFAQRQIFVVTIITFVTLKMDYRFIYIWPLGEVENSTARFAFNMTFLTLTILWFCQVAPKRLAILNSELFLAQAKFIWPLVKLVGKLDLPGPTDEIVGVMSKRAGYDKPRNLPPSRLRQYAGNAKLLGLALDSLVTEILLRDDGSRRITKRHVILFLHGHHHKLHGQLEPGFAAPGGRVAHLDVIPRYLGTASPGETFASITAQLDALALSDPDHNEFDRPIQGFGANVIEEAGFDTAVSTPGGGTAYWNIDLRTALPEGLRDTGQTGTIAVMVYDVVAECSCAALAAAGQQAWAEMVIYPCRKLSVWVRTEPNSALQPAFRHCSVTLGAPEATLEAEETRCGDLFMGTMAANQGTIAFPVSGALYHVPIDLIRFDTRSSGKTLTLVPIETSPADTNLIAAE